MIHPDRKYKGTIGEGAMTFFAKTGTLGLKIPLICDDGNTEFVLWFTDKCARKNGEIMRKFGIDPDKLADMNYVEMQLGNDLAGKEVSFGTRTERYKDKEFTRVAWIGASSIAPDKSPAEAMAEMFKKQKSATPEDDDGFPF